MTTPAVIQETEKVGAEVLTPCVYPSPLTPGSLQVVWLTCRQTVASLLAHDPSPTGGFTAVGPWQHDNSGGHGGKNIASRLFYRWTEAGDSQTITLNDIASSAGIYVYAVEWSGLDTIEASATGYEWEDTSLGSADDPWVYGWEVDPSAFVGRAAMELFAIMPSLNVNDDWHTHAFTPFSLANRGGSGFTDGEGYGPSGPGATGSTAKSWVGSMAGPEAGGIAWTSTAINVDTGGIDRARVFWQLAASGPGPTTGGGGGSGSGSGDTTTETPDDGINPPVVMDPAGVELATLDDAYDVVIQIDANGPGRGSFKINRYSPQATAVNLAGGNIIAVKIDRIDPDEPIFAFALEDENVKLISSDEEGGEYWDISGAGVMAYPNRAVWQAVSFTLPWWVGATPPVDTDLGQIEVVAGNYTAYGITCVGSRCKITSTITVNFSSDFTSFYDMRKDVVYDSTYFPTLAGQKKLLIKISDGSPHQNVILALNSEGITDHPKSLAYASQILLTDISADTPGAILYYLWQEALSADRPIHPTPLWDVDFTATTDSNGDPWTTTDALAGMTVDLGEDYLTTIEKLVGTGVLDVEMGPDFIMHAYNAPSGVDRTSTTFAAGKVRFEKGINIADELMRSLAQQPVPTWAEVIGDNSQIAHVTLDGSSGMIPRETSLRGASEDPTVLAAVGQAELQRRQFLSDGAKLNVIAPIEQDDLEGWYLPGQAWTANGKYWVRDIVSLKTGTGPADINDEAVTISSMTLSEDDAGYLAVTVEVGAVFMFVSGGGGGGVTPRPVPTVVGIGIRPDPSTGSIGSTALRSFGSLSSPGTADGGGTEVIDHLADATDAHDASAISFVPTGTIAGTNVQTAVAEVASEAAADLLAHLVDTSDAHDASAISVLDAGNHFAATDVEGALAELYSDLSGVAASAVVKSLTNKSGGTVNAGDVVIIDTANNDAFTTTTTGRAEVSIGIAQATIANNAAGNVLLSGYAALVNVPASVTRGHYVETHTVAKQGTGSATRRSGSFGQFLTGGTTPDAWIWGSADQTIPASTDTIDGNGALSIQYTFSTTTTDADPGNGVIRLSNATQSSAVTLRADLQDANGADVTAILDAISNWLSTTKGYVRIQHRTDPTKWLEATISAIASPSGYRNITIANIAKSTTSPLANSDPVVVIFVPGVLAHAASHVSGGGDSIKLDDLATPDDNTDLDASTGQHGLLKKLTGSTTNFLRADGSWSDPSVPAGTSYNEAVYGDGSDGDVTISVDTTLSRDMFYHNLTVNAGINLDAASSRIFVSGTLTLNGTIRNNGNTGGNGGNGTGAAGGAAGAAGTQQTGSANGILPDGPVGRAGAIGGINANGSGTTAGSNTDYGAPAVPAGQAGGISGSGRSGGAGGGVGVSSNVVTEKPYYWPFISYWRQTNGNLINLQSVTGTPAQAGSGGGAAGAGGGGSGGSGSSGGMVVVVAKKITSNGLIQAKGGNGGNGGNGFPTGQAGGGAGGNGGQGGVAVLVYSDATGWTGTVSAAGGTKGTKGTAGGGAGSTDGSDGQDGAAGLTFSLRIS